MENSDLFEYRFKREPKKWSISDIHTLYLKCLERESIQYAKLSSKLSEICEKIDQNNDRGERTVYSMKGGLCYHRTIYGPDSYSSIEPIRNRGLVRNLRIDLISSDDKFILGDELDELIYLHSHMSYIVLRHLKRLICYKISPDSWKSANRDKVCFIDINGKRYSFTKNISYESSSMIEIVEKNIIKLN